MDPMDDLVQFLRARLDEDEQAIEAPETWTEFDETQGTRRVDVDHSFERVTACTRAWRGVHIARHDPARVLREVEAKRQVLKLHERHTVVVSKYCAPPPARRVTRSCEPSYQFPELSWPCATLRLFALPYADHPDYQETWKP